VTSAQTMSSIKGKEDDKKKGGVLTYQQDQFKNDT
jgi:hypothetical protein